jgi:hypothetical protein
MTIEKGAPWGIPCHVPSHRAIATSDRELATFRPDEIISLSGGDIWKSLGSPLVPSIDSEATLVHIDAIQIEVDAESSFLAASSVEIGSFLSRQRYLCVANASFVREKNIAPRAHPNDGSLDFLEIASTMPFRQRWAASRRASTGTHIPHPHITTKRAREIQIKRQSKSEKLIVDGAHIREWHTLLIRVVPDHWQVVL